MKIKTIVLSLVFILLLALGIVTTNQYLKATELQNIVLSNNESITIAFSSRDTQIDTLVELVKKQPEDVVALGGEIASLESAQVQISNLQAVPKNISHGAIYKADGEVRGSLSAFSVSVSQISELNNSTNYQAVLKDIKNLNSLIDGNYRTYNTVVYDYNREIEKFPLCLFARLIKLTPYEYYA